MRPHGRALTRSTPAIVGLLVAWGGTAFLVSPIARPFTPASPVLAGVVSQIELWLLCAAIVGIVGRWEGRGLSTLWLRPLRWQSFTWAGALVVVSIAILFPITEWVRRALALPGYASGMQTALEFPIWLRVFAVITAGVVEETLFRGFAVTRLLELTGSAPLAVLLSSAAFAALHWPVWGAGPVLSFFLSGLMTSTFFVWRKDLATMIVAHAAVDLWGLVISPAFSQWWM